MAVVKDADKFNSQSVKTWTKKAFVKHFESRFENAEEIYNYHVPQKKKKVEDKID